LGALRRGLATVTSEAQRFQVVEMVETAQLPVRTPCLLDVIDFEPIGLA
jgi:hypothetical protein